MVSILYYLGIRREELVNGDPPSRKGDKQRMIPVLPLAFEAYQAYSRFRPECATPKIFINLKTRQPIGQGMWRSDSNPLPGRAKVTV